MLRRIACVLVLLLWSAPPAWAWGPEGHEIVAAIAAHQLNAKARAAVGALLGGDATAEMVLDAPWADDVRTDRPQTAHWHFVDIEIGTAGYDQARDCREDDCIVAQISRDAHILSDPRVPPPAKAVALKFLIHFVGDIHQPLHCADRHDEGGNRLTVYLDHRRTNLHHVWDGPVVTALGRSPLAVAAAIKSSVPPGRGKAFVANLSAARWADESFALAKGIYAGMPDRGVHLPADYPLRQAATVRRQLARAGFRLGAMLNRIFG